MRKAWVTKTEAKKFCIPGLSPVNKKIPDSHRGFECSKFDLKLSWHIGRKENAQSFSMQDKYIAVVIAAFDPERISGNRCAVGVLPMSVSGRQISLDSWRSTAQFVKNMNISIRRAG